MLEPKRDHVWSKYYTGDYTQTHTLAELSKLCWQSNASSPTISSSQLKLSQSIKRLKLNKLLVQHQLRSYLWFNIDLGDAKSPLQPKGSAHIIFQCQNCEGNRKKPLNFLHFCKKLKNTMDKSCHWEKKIGRLPWEVFVNASTNQRLRGEIWWNTN